MPRATIVSPITFSETPNSVAIIVAWSTNKSAPTAIKTAPRIKRKISLRRESFVPSSFDSTTWSSPLLASSSASLMIAPFSSSA